MSCSCSPSSQKTTLQYLRERAQIDARPFVRLSKGKKINETIYTLPVRGCLLICPRHSTVCHQPRQDRREGKAMEWLCVSVRHTRVIHHFAHISSQVFSHKMISGRHVVWAGIEFMKTNRRVGLLRRTTWHLLSMFCVTFFWTLLWYGYKIPQLNQYY